MSDYIEQAIARGVGEIGLTDHLFLYYQPLELRDPQWAMSEDQYPLHYEEMLELRDRYSDRIKVRVAVEADFVEGHEASLTGILSQYRFDYILGAVHFMDGWLIDAPENIHKYREERIIEIYRRYYSNVRKAVELNVFDVIAHLDLPKKFGLLPERELKREVNDVLDAIADHGVAVELSTAGLRKPIREIYPAITILQRMKQRDIHIVLSSDAHDPSEIAWEYESALQILDFIGYKTLITFDRREYREAPLG